MNKIGWLVVGVSVILLAYGMFAFVQRNGLVELFAWLFIVLSAVILGYFSYRLYFRGEA